jgi:hypothetical protein
MGIGESFVLLIVRTVGFVEARTMVDVPRWASGFQGVGKLSENRSEIVYS